MLGKPVAGKKTLVKTSTASNRVQATLLAQVKKGEAASFPHGSDVRSVAFNAAGTQLATGSGDKSARVYDLGTGQELQRFQPVPAELQRYGAGVNSVAWNATATQLATGSRDNFARVFDLGTDQELQTLEHGNAVNSVAWNAA